MGDKRFGSIEVRPRFSFYEELTAKFTFEMQNDPDFTEPIAMFEKNLLEATLFINGVYRSVRENAQSERLNELLDKFREEGKAAGL
jgi:hypothetical protein